MTESDVGNPWSLSDREVQLATLIGEKYRPIAEVVGLIAIEWNSMHNRLGQIFAHVTGLDKDVAYTIWNSIESDRKQRKILKDATIQVYTEERYREAREYITKLINRIDDASPKRNSSIHCPFTIAVEDGGLEVVPDDLAKNKHAEKLRDVDILTELQKRSHELDELNGRALLVLECLKILELGAPWPSDLISP